MASVSLVDVEKRYRGGVLAVSELSLTIANGELVSLVGPSGCGKSTVLSLLAGLETPSAGRILIDGRDVTGSPPAERDVAMVFQSYALYPHLDVAGNLAFPLKLAGLGRAEREGRVREVAQMLGIEALLDRRPAALSGGQRQRVALGRALVRRPKLFLFDEPLSNLDAGLRAQMRSELKRLHARLGATFVYVTHDQVEAMSLSDRVVVMREGRVQQVAPPAVLYGKPANTFVANFFGDPRINLVPPRILGRPEHPAALLGVRPEDLELLAQNAPGTQPARVELVEAVGPESWVTVELDGSRLTARVAPGAEPSPGAQVWMRVREASRLHAFDARGERLETP